MRQWIKNISPDIEATFSRFPFAIALSALSTVLVIVLTNDWIDFSDAWALLALGLSIGAVFAVAGVLYGESRFKTGLTYLIIAYVFPLLCVAALQIENTDWIIAPMLAPISLLWLSLAAFLPGVKGGDSLVIQNRFWWLNHRAITTAVIAGIGFGLIALGIVAVERAMAILFSVQTGKVFYEIILPFTGLFLTPVYWLSTIPKLDEYTEKDISEPDFLSKAIGFLGQFILSPFLFLYALILLAYMVQIVFTQSLPQGTLGWMVLGFTIVGAANWLVLHPSFMHQRTLVKYFRRFWFWLTIVPIILYALGVWVRIDIYGFTSERVGLVAGGLWAAMLTLAFLSRKFADIRLIPGIALAIIVFFSVGPWNFINGPQMHQAARLDAAIHNARPITQSVGGPYIWSEKSAFVATGAIRYLLRVDKDNFRLTTVLTAQGIEFDSQNIDYNTLIKSLNLDEFSDQQNAASYRRLDRVIGQSVDVSDTAYFYGRFSIFSYSWYDISNLSFKIEDDILRVQGASQVVQSIDIAPWLSQQSDKLITNPKLDFVYEGQKYRLLIENIDLKLDQNEPDKWVPTSFEMTLFSERPPPDNLPTANLPTQ